MVVSSQSITQRQCTPGQNTRLPTGSPQLCTIPPKLPPKNNARTTNLKSVVRAQAGLCLNDIAPDRVSDQFGSGFQAEIAHDLVFVGFRSSRRNVQELSDFLHCPALGQQT